MTAPLGTSYDVQGVDASPGSWPVGMIGIWSYELSRLPQNFAVCDGTKGTPDLRGVFPLGVDGSHALGTTGGSATLLAHEHDFTHENAHVVTDPDPTVSQQPEFFAHGGATELAHDDHDHPAHSSHAQGVVTNTEVASTPATGRWVPTYSSSLNATASLAHDHNHDVSTVPPHDDIEHTRSADVTLAEDPVTLSENSPTHLGGEVGAIEGTAPSQLPPYRALHFVMRLA